MEELKIYIGFQANESVHCTVIKAGDGKTRYHKAPLYHETMYGMLKTMREDAGSCIDFGRPRVLFD
jgi:hypothetical protein